MTPSRPRLPAERVGAETRLTHAFVLPQRPETAFDHLEEAVGKRGAATEEILAVTRRLRDLLEDAFRGRDVTEGSLLFERKRRLRHKLDHMDGHLVNRDWEAAAAHLAPLREHYFEVIRQVHGLETAPERVDRRRVPAHLRNAWTVARKEIVLNLQGVQGLVLFGIFLLTFGLGLEAALSGSSVAGVPASVQLVWAYAHSLDFLSVPLAGILLGYGLVNEERASGTVHFLASRPITREGIVIGKWLGMAATLGAVVGASALIVGGVALSVTGALGNTGAVVGYVASVYLLALAFSTLALLASVLVDRGAGALAAGFGAYVLLGPVWQNAFLVQSLRGAGATPGASSILLYLASPFTAWWNWTSEILGPRSDATGLPVGEPWHAALVAEVERGMRDGLPFYATGWFYVLVLLAWCALGLALAVGAFRRRDLI